MSTPAEITDRVLNNLKGRSGFDHWWDTIGEDIQEEIKQELEGEIYMLLEEHFLYERNLK